MAARLVFRPFQRCLTLKNNSFLRFSQRTYAQRKDDKVSDHLHHVPRFAPLEGIKVLDITRVLAGPYCSMILGDLGAEVIKLELPGTGDDTRSWGPPWVGQQSAYYLSINRNKKSIAVNMKTKEGAEIVQKLACKCDVFIENYIPGKLPSMGLGFDELHQMAPHLIYTSITGFGQSGPASQRAGYDNIAAAVGGLMHITGPADGEPCRVGVAMTDLSTGLYAHGAILAAILHRQKTGLGQHIDCNLLNTQVATLTHIASNWLNCNVEASRYGTGHGSIVPYQAFVCKDGYMMVGAGNNKLYIELCLAAGLDELGEDPDLMTNEGRLQQRERIVSAFTKKFAEKSIAEWMHAFEGCSFPYGPINNMQQVFTDPQVLHNQMVQHLVHSEEGSIRVAGPAVRYSEGVLDVQCPPPTLGQHTKEVLTDMLGYTSSLIDELHAKKVVG